MFTCKVTFIGGDCLDLTGDAALFVYNKMKYESQIPKKLAVLSEDRKELIIFTDKIAYVEKNDVAEHDVEPL